MPLVAWPKAQPPVEGSFVPYSVFKEHGGDIRTRTGSLGLAKPALYHLSYIPTQMVGLSGLEPLTSRLSGARSDHLSYRPDTT